MLKIAILALIAISISPIIAFAEPSIELSSDQKTIGSIDSILVVGKVSGVAPYTTVNLTVTDPSGKVVFSPDVPFNDNGEFRRLIHPPIPSFQTGTYTIVASHEQIPFTAQIQFTVTSEDLPRGVLRESAPVSAPSPEPTAKNDSQMYILANAVEGDTQINISGKSIWNDSDITLTVESPIGNLISVAQVTPNINGEFSAVIKIGGPLWSEDGLYTVTAFQGDSSQLQDTVQVEIVDGMVVPEFGTIAMMILAISIISIVVLSAKSKLSVMPRL